MSTTPLIYPAGLPCPISMPQQQAERRALTSLSGPRAVRALWRDRLVPAAPVTFRFSTLEQVEQFVAWLEDEQIQAGAWFAVDWRLTNGRVGVARFVAFPGFPQWLAPSVWECQGSIEIRGRSLPPEGAADTNCVDGPGNVAGYSLINGNGALFTNGSSPYGDTLDIASQNSVSVAQILKAYILPGANRYRLKFRVDAANADDAGTLEWTTTGGSQLIVNPMREAALDPLRRPYISLHGEIVYLLPGQIVVGEWYSLEVLFVSGAGNTSATTTRLSTGSATTVHSVGSRAPEDLLVLHFYADQNGVTCPTRYADLHVCTV